MLDTINDNKADLVTIRDFQETDRPFILASWLKGLYYGDSWFSLIPKDRFMAVYHSILESVLDAPGVSIRLVVLKDDPDVILGYSVAANTVLHWVYVKKSWRGYGLANMLVPAKLTAVTHLTTIGKQLIKKRPGVYFDPFLL